MKTFFLGTDGWGEILNHRELKGLTNEKQDGKK